MSSSVDSSKIGKNALTLFAPFESLNVLITDDGADYVFVKAVEEKGVRVIRAKSDK